MVYFPANFFLQRRDQPLVNFPDGLLPREFVNTETGGYVDILNMPAAICKF